MLDFKESVRKCKKMSFFINQVNFNNAPKKI